MVGTRMFGRIGSVFLRGFREIYLRSNLADEEWVSIKAQFDGSCCYCGVPDTGNPRTGLVPDHAIPAAKGGELIMGNVLPACHACNDQRGAKPWEEYLPLRLTGESQGTIDARRDKIRAFLAPISYRPPEPEDRLAPEQAKRYRALQGKFRMLLAEVRALYAEANPKRKPKNATRPKSARRRRDGV